MAQAAVRELFEETKVRAEARCVFNVLDAFDYGQDGQLRRQFVMIAVLCAWFRESRSLEITRRRLHGLQSQTCHR